MWKIAKCAKCGMLSRLTEGKDGGVGALRSGLISHINYIFLILFTYLGFGMPPILRLSLGGFLFYYCCKLVHWSKIHYTSDNHTCAYAHSVGCVSPLLWWRRVHFHPASAGLFLRHVHTYFPILVSSPSRNPPGSPAFSSPLCSCFLHSSFLVPSRNLSVFSLVCPSIDQSVFILPFALISGLFTVGKTRGGILLKVLR